MIFTHREKMQCFRPEPCIWTDGAAICASASGMWQRTAHWLSWAEPIWFTANVHAKAAVKR